MGSAWRCVPFVMWASVALCSGGVAEVDSPALKTLIPAGMVIGAAINQRQSDGLDPVATAIVTTQFNTVTPENLLKWTLVHPEPTTFRFEPADRYVAFGREHGMATIGHTLVWHQQTPAWVFAGSNGHRPDRETLLARMRAHVDAVLGRYSGQIRGWDVVNEALDEDGSLRRTPWLESIGEDYIARAFEAAHRADPEAELYYNDYDLWKPAKRAGAIRVARHLRELGLRIDAIGEQGHWGLERPTLAEIDATLSDIAAAGFTVNFTELDIDVLPREPEMEGADLAKKAEYRASTNLYPNGLPPEKQQQLAERYAEIFRLVLRHRKDMHRVTFWGVTDAQSWLNNFPIPRRVNYPLLWDRAGNPKPAYHAVVDVLRTSGER
jgi:endo-1,4-beta-xylanase